MKSRHKTIIYLRMKPLWLVFEELLGLAEASHLVPDIFLHFWHLLTLPAKSGAPTQGTHECLSLGWSSKWRGYLINLNHPWKRISNDPKEGLKIKHVSDFVFENQALLTSTVTPSNMKDVVFDDFSGPEASAVQQVLTKNSGLPFPPLFKRRIWSPYRRIGLKDD